MSYTKQDILTQLDQCAEAYNFPVFSNGYVYPIESRFTAYRDAKRWALIFEIVGFIGVRGKGHKGISNGLYVYGNCLDVPPGINTDNYISFTADSDEGPAFEEMYQEYLNEDVSTMLVRGKKIRLPKKEEFYELRKIELDAPPKVMIWEFLRGIRAKCRDLFYATEEELRARIPDDLPRILTIDEWRHNDITRGEYPSDIETFPMVADVLAQGDPALFKPTMHPNSYWKNWPEGGSI